MFGEVEMKWYFLVDVVISLFFTAAIYLAYTNDHIFLAIYWVVYFFIVDQSKRNEATK